MNSAYKFLIAGGLALAISSISQAGAQTEDFDSRSGTDRFLDTMAELAEDSVQPQRPPKKVTSDQLDDRAGQLTVESEISESDEVGYDAAAAESSAEAGDLKKEVSKLERQMRQAKGSAEKAKRKAFLAEKRLELKKKQQQDAAARLARTDSLKKKEEQSLASLQDRVRATEERLALAKKRTKVEQDALEEAQQARGELERRLRRAVTALELEKQRSKSLQLKRAKVIEQNRRLRSDASKLERRADRS